MALLCHRGMAFFRKQLGPFYIFLASLAAVFLLILVWMLGRHFLSEGEGASPLISEMLLPKSAEPEHYDFTFKVFLPGYESIIPKEKNMTFDAKLIIHLKTKEPLNVITVNSKNLDFNLKKCKFMTENGENVKISKISTDQELEKTQFLLEKSVPEGKHNITIVYNGSISDQLVGFYRTTYRTPEGAERIAAVTKLEPFYARTFIPCFDEPIFKATWNVTIIHPRGTKAISNSIELGDPEEENDFLVTKFKKTPHMSSYLFGAFISDFSFIEGHTDSGIRFRVWTRPEAKEDGDYALEAGIKCLEGYEKLYGIYFPLGKQDMVALPDFVSGAMENWGMVTFREALLLYDKKNYYFQNKARVTNIVAHELSHQWFGNLVTMKWWDDLWLSEGFAAFEQAIGADIITDGQLLQEEEFVADQLKLSMDLDGTAASHPLIYETTRAEEIPDLFDLISYKKGASLLAMIRKLVGKGDFEKGIQRYLKKYSYGNAEHRDLFRELDWAVPESCTGPDGKRLNITEFAQRWTLQMGYPYLTVSTYNDTHYGVGQERYKVDPNAQERVKFSSNPFGYKWDVPVWIQFGINPTAELRWLPAEGRLFVERGEEPVVVNVDSHAIARMNYDPNGWRKIFEQLELDNSVYSPRTKYRIISDVFAMAAIDNVTYDLALNCTRYLVSEKDYLPWEAVSTQINELYDTFGALPQRESLDTFVRKLIEPRFYDIDIRYTTRSMEDNKGYMSGRLDVLLWTLYCRADPTSCLSTVNFYFKGAMDACKARNAVLSRCGRIHPGIRGHVYNEAVRGSNENYQKILKFYRRETLQLERERLLSAMSSTTGKAILKEILSNITTPGATLFRNQDCPTVAAQISKNPEAGELLTPHLIEHWEELRTKFIDAPSYVNRIVGFFATGIKKDEELDKLKNFAEATSTTKKYQAFTQHIQKTEKRLEWLRKNAQSLEKLLPNVFG